MRIIVAPSSEGRIGAVLDTEVSSTISVDRDSATAIVWQRWSDHYVPGDQQLLQWLESLPEQSDCINVSRDFPQRDRLEYAIARLMTLGGDIQVTCHQCAADVLADDIQVVEKDFSTETDDMRMGFAGDLYLCPKGHGLMFVMTKIY